jgi:two-component system, chemotaxis family, response regulator PixG
MVINTSSKKLHPVGLLARMLYHKASGCLQVSSPSVVWSIYLEQGMLIYASNSVDPRKRIEQHLRSIDIEPNKLSQAIHFTHLFFQRLEELQESKSDDFNLSTQGFDYQVICWLVKNENLQLKQASALVKRLSREIIVSFLLIREGSYELVQDNRFKKLPKFCRLDISPLVKYRQDQANSQMDSGQTSSTSPHHETVLRQPEYQPESKEILNSKLNLTISPPEQIKTAHSQQSRSASELGVLSSIANVVEKPKEVSKKTYKVACIDDSPATLEKINSYLKNQGIAVLMIGNPVDALMQIVRNKPDLILLDVTMPNLDGYKLCSLLRRHPNFKNTPVIMVTGNTGLVDRAKAKLVGASGYITKPFTQSDLLGTIFMHLN